MTVKTRTSFRWPGAMGMTLMLMGLLLGGPAHGDTPGPECGQLGPGGELPRLVDAKLQPRTTLLCNAGYASLNSGLVHEPLWSAEHLTDEDVDAATGIGRVTTRFHADERLADGDAGTLADYRHSGFDRGHMTPSGDMPSVQAQEETFSLANVVPQTAALNEGVWTGVEMAVRDLARQDGEVYVVTGPAFHGSTRGIGNGVLVPTSTWKALYDPVRGGTGVYVCKNLDHPTCATVSVATLIRVVGIDPFPALSADLKATAMDLPQPRSSPYRPRRQSGDETGEATRRILRDGARHLAHMLEEE